MLWVVLAGMTGLAALAAVWPLVRGARRGASIPADAAFYKAQLGEIERDVARGFLPADEAAGARVEAARRLIAASAATADGAVADAPGLRRGWAIAIVVAAPVVALALYADLGRPDLPDSPLAQRKVDTRGMSGVEAALAHVEQQLAANPDNGPGWSLVAPVYMKLGRFDDAVEAYKQSLRLNGENAASARRLRRSAGRRRGRNRHRRRARRLRQGARRKAGAAVGALLPRPRRRTGRRPAEGDLDLSRAARRRAAAGAVDAGLAGAARGADRRRRRARRAARPKRRRGGSRTTRSRTR